MTKAPLHEVTTALELMMRQYNYAKDALSVVETLRGIEGEKAELLTSIKNLNDEKGSLVAENTKLKDKQVELIETVKKADEKATEVMAQATTKVLAEAHAKAAKIVTDAEIRLGAVKVKEDKVAELEAKIADLTKQVKNAAENLAQIENAKKSALKALGA